MLLHMDRASSHQTKILRSLWSLGKITSPRNSKAADYNFKLLTAELCLGFSACVCTCVRRPSSKAKLLYMGNIPPRPLW